MYSHNPIAGYSERTLVMDELSKTEQNALKWVLLKDYWPTRKARGTESENYAALVRFLKALGVED